MNVYELARAAEWLRDQEAFQSVISEIEAGLSRTFLDANTPEEAVGEAREVVRGLAAIKREIQTRIDAGKRAAKKDRHRASD